MRILVTSVSGPLGLALQDAIVTAGHTFAGTDTGQRRLLHPRMPWAHCDCSRYHHLAATVRRWCADGRERFAVCVHLGEVADLPVVARVCKLLGIPAIVIPVGNRVETAEGVLVVNVPMLGDEEGDARAIVEACGRSVAGS